MAKTKRLGDLLLEEEMITQEQLNRALEAQKTSRKTLGATFVELGLLPEDTLTHFLGVQHGLEVVDISKAEVDPALLRLCPEAVSRKLHIFPLHASGNKLTLAVANPEDPALLHLEYELVIPPGTQVEFVLASDSAMKAILDRTYAAKVASLEETVKEVAENGGMEELEVLEEGKTGQEEAGGEEGGVDEAPVIRLCNYILEEGIAKKASDIHINPFEKKLILRYRIDGALVEFPAPNMQYRKALVSRYKIMARLDPMERRKAQDGRIKYSFRGRSVDLRVSILPCMWGENIVMRIIDQSSRKLDIKDMDFTDQQMAIFENAYRSPYGMLLVTGPTGSGKTTTLYSVLTALNSPNKNIMTAEDPVEYRLPNLIQVQVNPSAGLTFAGVLKSFLRQDPNIIMVGEIRDQETANIAVKASLTGHLVISTLHTNDAPSTINRLVDMGIDPVYVGTSVLVVCAQKLLRRICKSCKTPWTPDPESLRRAKLSPQDFEGLTLFRGAGCAECNQTGYKGRLAVHEVLRVDSRVRKVIFGRGNLNDLRTVARQTGMASMREIAMMKCREGVTTLEEVLAETQVF
jgi:type IV pilus assembly protein PilB